MSRLHTVIRWTSTLFCFALIPVLNAQNTPYQAFFEEAYQKHSSIPRGVLESVAYTHTRLQHLRPVGSCQGLPVYYSVMGLVEDGKGIFQNSLEKVAELSGFTTEEIKADPRISILAYADAYAALQINKRLPDQRIENHLPIIRELSEIPSYSDPQMRYAQDQEFYGILQEMETPHTNSRFKSRRLFDYEAIFGKENYRVLSADRVTVEKEGIKADDGTEFDPNNRTTCTASATRPDYMGALFARANSRNYGSRDGADIKFVTVHTIQGSYASAIAWFKNRNARVSAHYIIRASDGQITQMVCESDKAYHVRTDNAEAIGIEHEGFIDDGASWYTNEMYQSSAALVRDICKRYDIDPLRTFGGPPTDGIRTLSNTCYLIKGHQHFRGNNHIDPGPFWDWDRYYRLINPTPAPTVLTKGKGSLTDKGGKDQNYPNGVRETYLIQPKNATEVTMEFKSFHLEGSEGEPFDYLDIYDGPDENGRFLGRFTGRRNPGRLVAQSGAFYLEFRSDCQINESGWELTYTSTRKNVDCEAPTELVASGIFPMGATLSWRAVESASQYLVYVRRSNLEEKWTLWRTPTNQVTVTGLSASAIYKWQVRAVCGQDTSASTGATLVTPSINHTSRAQMYTVQANQGLFYDSGGKLGGYTKDERYVYRILPADGGKVELSFRAFETEAGKGILTIYDGPNLSNAPKLGEYSGNNSPGTVRSSGNGLTLLFVSERSDGFAGWEARWHSLGGTGSTPTPDPAPTDPPVGPKPDPTPDPVDPPVTDAGWELNLDFPRTTPTTEPKLESQYEGGFSLEFADKDNSGRGLANRFYNVAQAIPGGWQGQSGAGFLYDNFDGGLSSIWNQQVGNWKVENGHLRQTNQSLANTNLWADLVQTGSNVYLYHWQARMTGNEGNRRHGLHFFASDPKQPDRGTSYFVWIRDQDDVDFVEIYKTVNDQFDRKIRREITLADGGVHDFKVIYNPKKGRIEVYVNNRFSGSWVDPYPLTRGKALSLRSGSCIVEYDELIVYQTRGKGVKIAVGEDSQSPLRGEGRFLVNSLVVDRRINWSDVGQGTSRIGKASPPPNDDPPVNNDPDPTPDPPVEPGNSLAASYAGDFPVTLPTGQETFFLPSDWNGDQWTANRRRGFLFEDYSGTKLDRAWRPAKGNWTVVDETLRQTDGNNPNSNLYLSVTQTQGNIYLYHFRAKMLSSGDNERFGMHFFASEGPQDNRGDSYLVWFRYHTDKPHRAEVYRTDNNQLARIRESVEVSMNRNQWHDFKVTFNPVSGLIEVYVDGRKALSWRDDAGAHRVGSFISFRTGNSQVAIDDVRIYHKTAKNPLTITVGPGEMIRYRDKVQLFTVGRQNGNWRAVRREETRIE